MPPLPFDWRRGMVRWPWRWRVCHLHFTYELSQRRVLTWRPLFAGAPLTAGPPSMVHGLVRPLSHAVIEVQWLICKRLSPGRGDGASRGFSDQHNACQASRFFPFPLPPRLHPPLLIRVLMSHRRRTSLLLSSRRRSSSQRSSDASTDGAASTAAPTSTRFSRTLTAGAPAWWGVSSRSDVPAAGDPRGPPTRQPTPAKYTRLQPSLAAAPIPPAAAVTATSVADADAPLLAAALSGDAATSAALLRAGSRADAVDAEGDPPVVVAARAGHAAVVEVLLWHDSAVRSGEAWAGAVGGGSRRRSSSEAGSSGVHARGDRGKTPLHWAAAGGHDAIVEMLLAAGAVVDATDASGGTALQEAVAAGASRAVEALAAAGAALGVSARRRPGEPLLYGAIVRGHLPPERRAAVVRALAAAGADVDAPLNDEAQTPLHVAVRARQSGVVAALLDAGARRTVIDASGRTPLGLCVADFPVDLVGLLLSKRRVWRKGNASGGWVVEGGCAGSAEELAALTASAKAGRRLLLWRALKELELGGGGEVDAACCRRRPPLLVLPPYHPPPGGLRKEEHWGGGSVDGIAGSAPATVAKPPSEPHVRRQPIPTLAGLNDLPAVYKAVVVGYPSTLLTLETFAEKLVAENARGVASLRAGHNLLCLAADAGLFSPDSGTTDLKAIQNAWQLGLYLPVHLMLAPADVPLARLIVTDATARGFLARWQAQLLQDHHHGGNLPSVETSQSLFLRAHRVDGVTVEGLVEAAGMCHRELTALNHRLSEVPEPKRRLLLIERVPRVGLSLVLLVAAALPRERIPRKAAAAVAEATDVTSMVERAALDFAVCHSNLRAALQVLNAPFAASQTALSTAVQSAWGSYDAFINGLASVVHVSSASASVLPSASLFSIASGGGGSGGGGGRGGTSTAPFPCSSDGGEPPTTSTVTASWSERTPPPLHASKSAVGP